MFRVGGKYIAVYRNNDYTKIETPYFYAEFTDIERVSKKRDVYCFDLEELVDRTSLLSIDDKWKFEKLKNAMRKRLIEFNSIECYYRLISSFPLDKRRGNYATVRFIEYLE